MLFRSSAVFSLRMICSAVCLVRFMLESQAQSGRMRTLIHPGLISGVHVIGISCNANRNSSRFISMISLSRRARAVPWR